VSCSKASYPDKRAAFTAMKVALRRRRNRPKTLRAYYCETCRAWHLTHKPLHGND
jgi:hypothetical protein